MKTNSIHWNYYYLLLLLIYHWAVVSICSHFFSKGKIWLTSVVAIVLSADKHTSTQPRLAIKENRQIFFPGATSIPLHSHVGLQLLMTDERWLLLDAPLFPPSLWSAAAFTDRWRTVSKKNILSRKSVASSLAPHNIMWLSPHVTAEDIAL